MNAPQRPAAVSRTLVQATLCVAVLAGGSAVSAEEAPVQGNIAGLSEHPVTVPLAQAMASLKELMEQLRGDLESVDTQQLRELHETLATAVDDTAAELARGTATGSFQETTDVRDISIALARVQARLRQANQTLVDLIDQIEFGSDTDKASRKADGAYDRVFGSLFTAAFGLLGLRAAPKAPAHPLALAAGGGNYVVGFQSRGAKSTPRLQWDGRDREGKLVRFKVTKARVPSPFIGERLRFKRGGPKIQNRYLSVRARSKRAQDVDAFLTIDRELRGPFEFGFSGGVFRDDPKPLLYRGDAFVAMEVGRAGANPAEFVTVGVRYAALDDEGVADGVQVFLASHEGNHGTTFLNGAKRADVKVVYDGVTFEAFVKPYGASDTAFVSFGTFTHTAGEHVWKAGVGGANLAGKTELGIDDVVIHALGGEESETDPGGGGGPSSASASVNELPWIPDTIAAKYSRIFDEFELTLTKGNETLLLTSGRDVTGPGTYVPNRFLTNFKIANPGSITTAFSMIEGTGELFLEAFDEAAGTCRGTFFFEARGNSSARRNITNGVFDIKDMDAR